jgi:hypothetical protein
MHFMASQVMNQKKEALREPAQRLELVALNGVGARGAVLDPADVEHGAVEVDLPKRSESER